MCPYLPALSAPEHGPRAPRGVPWPRCRAGRRATPLHLLPARRAVPGSNTGMACPAIVPRSTSDRLGWHARLGAARYRVAAGRLVSWWLVVGDRSRSLDIRWRCYHLGRFFGSLALGPGPAERGIPSEGGEGGAPRDREQGTMRTPTRAPALPGWRPCRRYARAVRGARRGRRGRPPPVQGPRARGKAGGADRLLGRGALPRGPVVEGGGPPRQGGRRAAAGGSARGGVVGQGSGLRGPGQGQRRDAPRASGTPAGAY